MKYIVQIELDPDIGADVEEEAPQQIQEMTEAWQALNPIGMYFSLTSRAITIILDAANEDAFFEPLHKTWLITRSYPDVWPVVGAEEFPAIAKRVGIMP